MCSVKHEYDGDWKGNSTRLKTCDPHARRLIVDSDSPQEVEANKEIIFSYDISFEVWPSVNLFCISHSFCKHLLRCQF